MHLNKNPQDIIIPTWVITPLEKKDNFDLVKNNYQLFINYLRSQNYLIEDLIILENDLNLWNDIQEQTFFSPCIACHLYCHLLRLPLAKTYSANILTGERKSHDGSIKVNQNNFVLNWFANFFTNNNYHFIKPLIDVIDSNEIKIILKNLPFDVLNKENFISCSMQSKRKTPDLNYAEIQSYLDLFLKPIMEEKYV